MILVLNDCALMRDLVVRLLESRGERAQGARDASEAAERIRRGESTAMLLTLEDPSRDAERLLGPLRRIPGRARTPVLALVPCWRRDTVQTLVRLGADDVIATDSVTADDLLKRIDLATRGEPPPWWPAALVAKGVTPAALRGARSCTTDPHEATTPPSAGGLPREQTRDHRSAASHAHSESVASAAPSPPGHERHADAPSDRSIRGEQRAPIDALAPIECPPPPQNEADLAAALRSLRPVVRRSDLQDLIDKASEIRAMSPAVAEVLRITGQPGAALKAVVDAIRVDHAIAVKILKLANSPVYTRGDQIDSLQQAVARIGLQNIRQAVLNISVVDSFGSANALLDTGLFWEHAIACGLICAELSRTLNIGDADSAFTMGLVHDLGRVILAEVLGDGYRQVLEVAERSTIPAELVEKRTLLMDHGEVADRVLHTWRFPRNLIDPVVFHHSSPATIRKFAPQEAQQVIMLGLANRLAKALLLGSSGNLTVYPIEELCESLRVNEAVVRRIGAEIPDRATDLKFALLARSHAPVWPQIRDQLRTGLPAGFRPIYAGPGGPDAHQLLCERLADGPDASEPNISVIWLRQPRDAPAVCASIQRAEAEAGVRNLPLLVLSPGGRLKPPNAFCADRVVRVLPTPLHLRRFVADAAALIGAPASEDATAAAA